MGLFSTHWLGDYEGHKIEVVRRMGGHEFELLIDDKKVDSASSMVNMGERKLKGTLQHGGKDVPVFAHGIQHGFSETATVPETRRLASTAC
jgi:hypothetical protein